jgi:proteasome assembly chaperone (PAC2) family protein
MALQESKPSLKDPYLVAAWPGMGLVAHKAVDYLIKHLPAELVKKVELEGFTALHGIALDKGVIQPVELPVGQLFAYAPAGEGRDLLFYLGGEQPVSGKEWALATAILDEVEPFGVRRICTMAAMPTDIDHRADPGVWACATDQALLDELTRFEIKPMLEGSISGLNGLLLGVAHHRGIDGCCLLGEIPTFMTQMENPRSSGVVIERLMEIIGLSVDLSDLRMQAQATAAQIDVFIERMQRRIRKEGEDEDGESGETN